MAELLGKACGTILASVIAFSMVFTVVHYWGIFGVIAIFAIIMYAGLKEKGYV